jgi:predicted alpha/beta hydrolase
MHIIGHSLGAHIAGYAGDRTPNLGRITGEFRDFRPGRVLMGFIGT